MLDMITIHTMGDSVNFPFYVKYCHHNINLHCIDVYYETDPFRDKNLDNPLSYIYLN